MNFSAKDVAVLALKRAPSRTWCYLWIQPVSDSRWLRAFSLLPPFKKKTWICVGKIRGSGNPKRGDIDELTDRILWSMEMHRSFHYKEPKSS